MSREELAFLNKDYEEKYGFSVESPTIVKLDAGLSEDVVLKISEIKHEPEWMRERRVKALQIFMKKPMPVWGGDMSGIDFDKVTYFLKSSEKTEDDWEKVPAEIKKTFERLGIPEAERKFLAGAGAQFECLSGDSLVYTNPKGPIRIDSIKPGDKIFAYDEKERKLKRCLVKKFGTKGSKQVYELKVGTRKIKASENHPFLSLIHYKKPEKRRGRYKVEWRNVVDLKKGDLVAVVKELPDYGEAHKLITNVGIKGRNYKNTVNLPKATTKDLLWFFGLYVGDGFIHREEDKARVEIAIPKQEANLRKILATVVRDLFEIELVGSDKDRVTIYSTLLSNYIEVNGFKGNAHTKRIPQWVYSLPKDQKMEMLAGYIDSDGYVRDSEKNKDPVMKCCNKELMNDVKKLLLYCGLNSSSVHKVVEKNPFKEGELSISYNLQLSGDTSKIPCRNEKRLERLFNKKYFHDYSHAHNTTFRKHTTNEIGFGKISSIKPVGIEPVYDIEIEGIHNFVAEGFIVHNSEGVYHKLREDLMKQGVIFCDMDMAVKEHQEIVKTYFGTIVPAADNKFAALNTACWSGGSFIYVPKGVKVNAPLQAYFRINAKNMGQFERTLIIADEGAEVTYFEGCTSPTYSSDSLHAAVVELIAMKDAKIRYVTLQNWSSNVYNLVTKRAVAHENATVEWLDANVGSKLTMKYPSVFLKGRHAKADILSIAFAGKNQHQDAGGKAVHLAPETTSRIISKSISKGGGRASYRGLLRVAKNATGVKATVKCDALLLDDASRSDTYPTMQVEEQNAVIAHEATVGKIGEDQVFYLMARGLSEHEAMSMIVLGFISDFVKELPMEYAIEFNKLIMLEMENAIG